VSIAFSAASVVSAGAVRSARASYAGLTAAASISSPSLGMVICSGKFAGSLV
jgi:hypothetical protein